MQNREPAAKGGRLGAGQRDVTYTVELEPTEPSGYAVTVPALPGVLTFGDTLEEVLANARAAITLHVRGLVEDGEAVPVEEVPRRRGRTVRLPVPVHVAA